MKKAILISGPLTAVCLMMGTALGSSSGNIAYGAIYGVITGFAISSLLILWKYYAEKKGKQNRVTDSDTHTK